MGTLAGSMIFAASLSLSGFTCLLKHTMSRVGCDDRATVCLSVVMKSLYHGMPAKQKFYVALRRTVLARRSATSKYVVRWSF